MTDRWKLKQAPAGSSKKWQVTIPGEGGRTKTVKFGARGYEDYTQHKDKSRRENYRSRHRNDNLDDPRSPGFWSWYVLWGDTTDRNKAFASAVRRAKKLLPRENPAVSAKKRDLLDAIDHASQWRDEPWTLDNFRVIPMGKMTVQGIERYADGDDFSSWLEVDPRDYEGMPRGERLEELQGFRGAERWTDQIPQWLEEGIPPVVIIEAPVYEEGELVKVVGDGRGRINMATALGIKLPVVVMRWKGAKRTNPELPEGTITPGAARALGRDLNVDWGKVNLEQFRRGIEVEWEHAATVRGDLLKVGRIALDHLEEDPEYYTKLDAAFENPRSNPNDTVTSYDLISLARLFEDSRGKNVASFEKKRLERLGFVSYDDEHEQSDGTWGAWLTQPAGEEVLERARVQPPGDYAVGVDRKGRLVVVANSRRPADRHDPGYYFFEYEPPHDPGKWQRVQPTGPLLKGDEWKKLFHDWATPEERKALEKEILKRARKEVWPPPRANPDVGMTEAGRWGNEGSGILFVTPERRLLLLQRSDIVLEPGTWGIPGGAIPEIDGELEMTPLDSALREAEEEIGGFPDYTSLGDATMVDDPDDPSSFRYTTFLFEVEDEFWPDLNHEHDDYVWATLEEALRLPLHPGVRALLECLAPTL